MHRNTSLEMEMCRVTFDSSKLNNINQVLPPQNKKFYSYMRFWPAREKQAVFRAQE